MFELATGTVTGRHHRDNGTNSQDASYFIHDGFCTVAIVCDGCGTERHSEVGAKLGARLVAQSFKKYAQELPAPDTAEPLTAYLHHYMERVRQDVLANLRVLAHAMSDTGPRGFTDAVFDHFMFTIVGAVITDAGSLFFSIGDGVMIVNGCEIRLGQFPENRPPFLGYGLTGTRLAKAQPELIQFQIHRHLPTDELTSFLIGTDGTEELMQAAENNLPGRDELVGSISQFWEQDKFFANPDMINRRLRLINRDVARPDWNNQQLGWERGRLHDDTTFIVGRRKEQ